MLYKSTTFTFTFFASSKIFIIIWLLRKACFQTHKTKIALYDMHLSCISYVTMGSQHRWPCWLFWQPAISTFACGNKVLFCSGEKRILISGMLNSGFLASLLGTVSAPPLQPHFIHGMCTLALECRSFISQGSIDTRLRHSGMFSITFLQIYCLVRW